VAPHHKRKFTHGATSDIASSPEHAGSLQAAEAAWPRQGPAGGLRPGSASTGGKWALSALLGAGAHACEGAAQQWGGQGTSWRLPASLSQLAPPCNLRSFMH